MKSIIKCSASYPQVTRKLPVRTEKQAMISQNRSEQKS